MFLLCLPALMQTVDSCRVFFFQAEDGIRDLIVTGVQTCALPISLAGLIALTLPALVVGFRQDADYHREWVERVALENAPGTGNWASNGDISLRAQADRKSVV